MIEFQYTTINYTDFIDSLASVMKVKARNGFITVPPAFGDGYFWAINLPDGISVMISDSVFKDDVLFQRGTTDAQYFILMLNESVSYDPNLKEKELQNAFYIHQNNLLLTTTLMNPRFLLPADIRVRSVRIVFEKKHLLRFFDNETIDLIISRYFLELLKNKNAEPIDAEYRIVMNELIKETIDHPLKTHFIQNRVMLLLERFIKKLLVKITSGKQPSKLTEDEVGRLMRVEALLVKDFSSPPPTIDMLSRFAAMSATKLKTDFKSLYGMPDYEYYQKNRMMFAKSLLLENKYAIKEVGNMVGYTNLGHFAGSFKKEFGILPSEIVSNNNELNDEDFLYNKAVNQ